MTWSDALFLVGAPRSGTSLLQQVLREQPGFASVPRESDVIWEPYIHPENNGWKGEGFSGAEVSAEISAALHQRFSELAVSAETWRRWSSAGLMKNPGMARVLRLGYRFGKPVLALLKFRKGKSGSDLRLIDKSVHMGLWLSFVHTVFPGCRFIHIVRDPLTAIPSIIHGWQQPERFNTYLLPLDFDGEDFQWKFPLPPGWEAVVKAPVEDRAAFQWIAIQEAILRSAGELGMPYYRIRLEDLAATPRETLEALFAFAAIDWNPIAERYARELPKVNARESKGNANRQWLDKISPERQERIEVLRTIFGYSE
ncbi:MAG: sulfotransferase [Sumerlaeia bacterium]